MTDEDFKKLQERIECAIDIFNGRLNDIDRKIDETQGLVYTTRRELEGGSLNSFAARNSIEEIPFKLNELREDLDKLSDRVMRLEDFKNNATANQPE